MKRKVIWLTGLSGSGKTTIARELSRRIANSMVLDGDVLRSGLCSDLGFSLLDRNENIRRVGEIAALLFNSGQSPICSFISPVKARRDWVRSLVPLGSFIEVHVDCPLEVCKSRDPKGLYEKALKGKILQFTGITSPYEKPEDPEVTVNSNDWSIDECVEVIMNASGFTPSIEPRHVFVGRWNPIHNGHLAIIKKVVSEDPGPVLILVRNTSYDELSSDLRCKLVEAAMEENRIRGEALIIPDVASVNWGRGVGYATRCIDVPESVKRISATTIRDSISSGDHEWVKMVPLRVSELLKRELEK